MNRRRFAAFAVSIAVTCTALCASAAQRTPTSPKDRKRIAELADRLETAPLAKRAKKDRAKILTMIDNAPDLQVQACRALLGELLLVKRLEAQQLYVQLRISTARYLIEHPDASADRERALTGGIEGVLRTYENMHHTNPALTITFVDDLVERTARDGVDAYVRESLGDCDR